jgi:hypothetical protein
MGYSYLRSLTKFQSQGEHDQEAAGPVRRRRRTVKPNGQDNQYKSLDLHFSSKSFVLLINSVP